MDRGDGAAVRLPESDRKTLAIQALAGSETVSDLAARLGVSRKLIYQQTHKPVAALDDAFLLATHDHEVESVKNLGQVACGRWSERPG